MRRCLQKLHDRLNSAILGRGGRGRKEERVRWRQETDHKDPKGAIFIQPDDVARTGVVFLGQSQCLFILLTGGKRKGVDFINGVYCKGAQSPLQLPDSTHTQAGV